MDRLGIIPEHDVVGGAAGALNATVAQQEEVEQTHVDDARVYNGARNGIAAAISVALLLLEQACVVMCLQHAVCHLQY